MADIGTLTGDEYKLQPNIIAGTPKVYTPLLSLLGPHIPESMRA